MNKTHNHPYHLVTNSPWPILMSFNLMITMLSIIQWMNERNTPNLFMLSMLLNKLILYQWWRDITRESTYQGCHTTKVSKMLRFGMILFIVSEILFFISFFWTFFHLSLSPSIEIGNLWPPKNIIPFNPYNIPLLNTMILLISGITITCSHYFILSMNYNKSMYYLSITLMLGMYFTYFQFIEYNESFFTMSDSAYGSIFFLITGFHGLHVIIGSIFILMTNIRLMKMHFSPFHHFGFEASAWYWHFVDVIWLFVYISLYWWKFYF